MKDVWKKARYPGVRFREHHERRYNRQMDRYFTIRYKRNGKSVTEAVGWASHGMNEQKANMMRAEIIQNIREGKRPQSLAEKRQIEKDRIQAQKTEIELKKQKNVTFVTLADEFLRWAKVNKKDHVNDKSRYQNHINPVFGDMAAKDVSPFLLEQFKSDLMKKELSPKTIHNCLTLIRTIFRKGKIWGLYSGEIPTEKITFPKIDNIRTRFLSHQEASDLLEILEEGSEKVYHQALLSMHAGLRFSEIANLTWTDLDLENEILQIRNPKGGVSRQAFITEPLREIFLSLKDEGSRNPKELVFPNTKGGAQQQISKAFYKAIDDLGFNDKITDRRQKVVFHTLRHTFGSWLAIQGTSLYEIMELMGHKDIKMTQRYAHLMPSVKRAAVNKMAATFLNHQKEEDPKIER